MTGFNSKRKAAHNKMEDDDIQTYQRPWVGLTDANMKELIEQARVVPTQVPCPDYNERLLTLANSVLKELNT